MQRRPNIVMLFTDDQRFDTIQALGNPDISTPNMDRLVRSGTALTQAHIPCGTSGAVCMPSRAMLHSGRTLFHLQDEGQEIPDQHTTLGEWLGRHGYQCFGAGKWHNGTRSYARSFHDGGSIFFGGMWDHWNVPVCDYDPTGLYQNQIHVVPDFFASNRTMQVHCDRFSSGKHSSELISDEGIRFISRDHGDQPFFLYLAYLAPHDPRTMPDSFRRMYDPETIRLPENAWPSHPFAYGVEDIRDERLAAFPRDPAEIRMHVAEYDAMISHLDFEIGRVLDALEHAGLSDETIVVLAGDNGLAVGQHGLMGKQSCYEHSIRVPLLMRGPGIPAGQQHAAPAYLFDLFPTLCDLAGLDTPSSVEGQSLAPALSDPHAGGRDILYFAYTDLIRAVKDRRWKLVEYAGPERHTQLFDWLADPSEMHSRHDDPACARTLAHMREHLRQCRDSWDDLSHRLGRSFWQDRSDLSIRPWAVE